VRRRRDQHSADRRKGGRQSFLERQGHRASRLPLSGTGAQARVKDLVVYASGDKAAFSKTVPFLKGFSRAHYTSASSATAAR